VPRRTSSTSRTAPRRDPAGRPPAGRATGAPTATLERAEPADVAPESGPIAGRAGVAADRASADQPPAGGGSRRDRRVQRQRAPRHRLLLACTAVLALGLIGVLLLNTIISQGAFRQHELEIDLILTAEEEEALARAVQQAEAPIEVERKARALGMVPAAAPVFLRLSDGAILGEPVPAPQPTGPVDFKGAPGIQPTPRPRPAARESAQPDGPAPVPGATDAVGTDPAADPSTGTDPAADPSTGIDPALDPSTGLQPDAAASPAPDSSAGQTPAGVNP
jgi:hypothetical protein